MRRVHESDPIESARGWIVEKRVDVAIQCVAGTG